MAGRFVDGAFAGSAAMIAGGSALAWLGLRSQFDELAALFIMPGDTVQTWTERAKKAPLPVAIVGMSAIVLGLSIFDGEVASLFLWTILALLLVRGRLHLN